MTERSTAKIKRTDDLKPARKAPQDNEMRAENVRLRNELEAAYQRIAVLEDRNKDALNRIEWVIDSLHNLARDE